MNALHARIQPSLASTKNTDVTKTGHSTTPSHLFGSNRSMPQLTRWQCQPRALRYLVVPRALRRRRTLLQSLDLKEKLLQEADSELLQIKQTWEIGWDDVQLGGTVGAGTFGDVYTATWLSQSVAVKVLREGMVQLESAGFQEEATTMSRLRHPNIVVFYGAGVTPSGAPFLVTEFMGTGSLRAVLRDKATHAHLSWQTRLRFCQDTAAGMLFLHTRKPPMLHREITAIAGGSAEGVETVWLPGEACVLPVSSFPPISQAAL